MSIPTLLDHVVIAGPDLADLVDWFEAQTGVRAVPGGKHPTGTANALVALTISDQRGPWYLELIGPDPERESPELPTRFGIDGIDRPTIATYAVHPHDIDDTVRAARARGASVGDVADLARRLPSGELLEWRLTSANEGASDEPFLIDWGSAAQPGLSDIPTIELESFIRVDPEPAAVRERLALLGLGEGVAPVEEGSPARFRMQLRGARGADWLGE